MRSTIVRAPFVLAVALAFTLGCGDETTEPSSAVSEEAAAALADQLLSASVNTLDSPSPSLAASVPINVQFSNGSSCPGGGNINVSGNLTGSFDTDTGSGSAWLQVLETVTDCTVTANGVNYVANGNPYLSMTGSFTWLNGAPATQQTLRIGGALDINGRFCAITLTILYSTTGGSNSISGTVCGVGVNQTF
jgi:hypothetical protein